LFNISVSWLFNDEKCLKLKLLKSFWRSSQNYFLALFC
jgi:hypothetical protein